MKRYLLFIILFSQLYTKAQGKYHAPNIYCNVSSVNDSMIYLNVTIVANDSLLIDSPVTKSNFCGDARFTFRYEAYLLNKSTSKFDTVKYCQYDADPVSSFLKEILLHNGDVYKDSLWVNKKGLRKGLHKLIVYFTYDAVYGDKTRHKDEYNWETIKSEPMYFNVD